ncbi:HET-domain-containing protein [Xylariomycetidae sp. FL2044]|nr:HET-domain-containing protein [Xylariomycetidae sp. FL2044]
MRLLNAHTFIITDHNAIDTPPYAILSHTWGEEEVTFVDMTEGKAKSMKGYSKIEGCCKQAISDGLEFVRSSAELSEAINSMFNWYRDAAICYAYLEDVSVEDGSQRAWSYHTAFTSSSRPPIVVFFSAGWVEIGTRDKLQDLIVSVTRISRDFFQAGRLGDFSIAQKMSWASRRQTTRVEDQAYCLLGLFGVTMPLLYGEGDRAFTRLQEEIMKESDDQTIFAWTSGSGAELSADWVYQESTKPLGGLLASSPAQFAESNLIQKGDSDGGGSPYSITNKGVQITLPVLQASSNFNVPFVPFDGERFSGSSKVHLQFSPTGDFAVLNCRSSNEPVPVSQIRKEAKTRQAGVNRTIWAARIGFPT